MGEERLTGLALLNIHKKIPVNVDDIISKFGKKQTKKVKLCNLVLKIKNVVIL